VPSCDSWAWTGRRSQTLELLMPTLDRITLYPVKSLDGVDVAAARVLPSGALENDRRWRLVDMEGRVVNAKRTPLFHAIRAEFALDERLVTLCVAPAALTAAAIPGIDRLQNLGRDSFHLVPGEKGPCGWLSEALGIGVLLEERPLTCRAISRPILTPIFPRLSPRNSRSAKPGFGRRMSASGAWCRAARAVPGPSRPISATRSRPAGAGACGLTWMPVAGTISTGWVSTRG
jgi:hypothetical protein